MVSYGSGVAMSLRAPQKECQRDCSENILRSRYCPTKRSIMSVDSIRGCSAHVGSVMHICKGSK